jgi:hypothetical protein
VLEAAWEAGSRTRGRPLAPVERSHCERHFEAALLDAVLLFDGRVPFWLRPDMQGVTLGPRIYFRRDAYHPGTAGGIELLAHEIAHVRQYRDGMTIWSYLWASRRGYRRNRYEVEARDRCRGPRRRGGRLAIASAD